MGDVRYAVRVLRKSPVFTVTAVLTLALGIGANTAIYTVVDRVLLRSLPYPQPERLAQVVAHWDRSGDEEIGQTGATWEALRDGVTTADLAVYSGAGSGVNLVAHDQPEYVLQQRVSAGFFRVLGVSPVLGREFTADEDRPQGPAVAVLGNALWRRLFDSDPGAIGQSIALRGEPFTVVGVMPEGFIGNALVDLWTPVRASRAGEGGGLNYQIIARLRTGVSWPQAQADIAALGQAAVREARRASGGVSARVVPLRRPEAESMRQPLLILWVAVGAVLLIGCVNIAGLLLARGALRAPEMAMRVALGGGRAAIVRQLLTESVVLAAAGGALGIAMGAVSLQLLATLLGDAFGLTGHIALDSRVLAITAAMALATSVVFGLLPALQLSRVNLRETLVESGSSTIAGAARSWPRRAMVVAELALGVVLLVGAGLLIRTFDYLMRQRAGFDGTNIMTATLSLQDARYQTADKVNRLFDQSLARMRQIAGVQNAAACLTLPYERALNTGSRWIGARPGSENIPIMNLTYVTPGYFEALRIPIVRGRVFTDADGAQAAWVTVVNQAFVKRYSPDEDPIGRQMGSSRSPRTIVGIVGDVQQQAGWGNFGPLGAVPSSYIPAAQTDDASLKTVHTWFSPNWLVRLAGPQEGIVAQMQRAVQSVDPLLPFAKFRTFDEVRAGAVATQRALTLLLSMLAALALVLAAVGLFGLVASSVAERTRELGVRMALGSTPSRAVAAAAGPALTLALIGVAIGLAIARATATILRTLLWGVSARDPLTFVLAATVVLLVAAVATLLPALRVVRLNPIKALRQS